MTISVIIPTLNEAHRLPSLLAHLRDESADIEIIVVDGGSRDETRAVAMAAGAHVLTCNTRARPATSCRRGKQRRATSYGFYMPTPPIPAAACGRSSAFCPTPSGDDRGQFSPAVRWPGRDSAAGWTVSIGGFAKHGVYYGDSAVFVRRTTYQALGGIRPIALMEDYDFNRRMEKAGRTCCIADPPLITSSRRFAGRHPAAIVWGWVKIHLLFYLGVSPDRLARLYDSQRRQHGKRTYRRHCRRPDWHEET